MFNNDEIEIKKYKDISKDLDTKFGGLCQHSILSKQINNKNLPIENAKKLLNNLKDACISLRILDNTVLNDKLGVVETRLHEYMDTLITNFKIDNTHNKKIDENNTVKVNKIAQEIIEKVNAYEKCAPLEDNDEKKIIENLNNIYNDLIRAYREFNANIVANGGRTRSRKHRKSTNRRKPRRGKRRTLKRKYI